MHKEYLIRERPAKALLLFALTSDFIRKRNREKQLLEASKKNG